jgi:hypothetical protein
MPSLKPKPWDGADLRRQVLLKDAEAELAAASPQIDRFLAEGNSLPFAANWLDDHGYEAKACREYLDKYYEY